VENNRRADVSIDVRCVGDQLVAGINHLTYVASEACTICLKDVQVSTRVSVITNCGVATNEVHVASLAFSAVAEQATRIVEPITVPVLLTGPAE